MNLHRVEGKADWADVPPASRTFWQQVAAASSGIVTIGNLFSLIGLVSVPVGLWLVLGRHENISGAVVFVLGRLCDLADGWLADKTGTKSPLGEIVDATFDKISTVATVVGLGIGHAVPVIWLFLVLAPHVIIAGIASLAYFRDARLHPSRAGKLSMGFGWAFLIAAIIAAGMSQGGSGEMYAFGFWTGAFVLLAISFVLGVAALIGYISEYTKAK